MLIGVATAQTDVQGSWIIWRRGIVPLVVTYSTMCFQSENIKKERCVKTRIVRKLLFEKES